MCIYIKKITGTKRTKPIPEVCVWWCVSNQPQKYLIKKINLKTVQLRKIITEEPNPQKWVWINNEQSLSLKIICITEFGVEQASPVKVQFVKEIL